VSSSILLDVRYGCTSDAPRRTSSRAVARLRAWTERDSSNEPGTANDSVGSPLRPSGSYGEPNCAELIVMSRTHSADRAFEFAMPLHYRPRMGISTVSAGSSGVVTEGNAKKSLPAAAKPT